MTDRNFRPCKCGYQICLFCYNKIKDNHNGACPACRFAPPLLPQRVREPGAGPLCAASKRQRGCR